MLKIINKILNKLNLSLVKKNKLEDLIYSYVEEANANSLELDGCTIYSKENNYFFEIKDLY